MASQRLTVTALTALALTVSAAVSARDDNKQAGGKDQERLAAWASKLGLSTQQQERIHTLCNEFCEKADPVAEQLWKLHHEEFDAMKGVLSEEQREKLPAAIKNLMTRECRAFTDKLGLSEDQRQKVGSIREEYEPKFREVCAESSETARKKMHELKSEFFGDIRRVLTDDQRGKFWGVLHEEFHQWRDPVARHERMEELGEQLGVSADQKAQIQKIRSEFQPKIDKLATQLKDFHHEERASIEKELTEEQRTKAHDMWKDLGANASIKARE